MTAVSFTGELKNLQPQKVWQLFEEMTKIYRESGPSATNRENNKEISNYLVDKLTKLGFEVEQVQEGSGKYNVYAGRNLKGNEDKAIILQGHMDMVCISDNKDPKKPIKLNIEGDILRANNRTLGADNGIGLAIALAIAEEPQFKDLPLQIICTVDEETGMYGAAAMKPEDLKGHYLINIDSEEFGEITIGCAGMDTFKEIQPVPTKTIGDTGHKTLTVSIKNATGGHSGVDINKGRLNPIKAVLEELANTEGIRISEISGGEKANSIPREVTAKVLVPEAQAAQISEKLSVALKEIQKNSAEFDPNLEVSVTAAQSNAPTDTKVLQKEFQQKLLQILGQQLHCGIKSVYDNGDNKTSQNLGILELKNGNLELQVSMRSSDQAEKDAMFKQTTSQLSELLSKEVKSFNSSPIWQPKEGSPLTKLAAIAYKECGVSNPRVYTCHGGLENAQFAEKRPDIDEISVGPDIADPHTVKERISISSVEKFYAFMQNLVEKLKSQ